MVGFLSSAAFIIFDFVQTLKAQLTLPPYQDIVEQFGLTPESSDESIEQAILSMNELSKENKRCEAGWVHAVTKNGRRIIVPDGVLESGKASSRVTQDTLFEIGSISKPITGLVLAQKVTAGLVTVDTPLNDLLPDSIPDLIVNGTLVTFGQLVTHTAGVPSVSTELAWRWIFKGLRNLKKFGPYQGFTEEELLQEIGNAAGELSQSGEFDYSNFGFAMLAYLLGRNENTSFPDLQKALTDQLGMNNTWIGSLPDEARIHLSTGYIGSKRVPYWFDDGLLIDGSGSTLSSARDLCQYLEALMSPNTTISGDGDLIDALKLSITPLIELSPENNGLRAAGVAYAWWLFSRAENATLSENVVYRHTGGTGGFATSATFQPSTQTGIISMTNCRDAAVDLSVVHGLLSNRLLLSTQESGNMVDLMPNPFLQPLN